MKSFAHSVLLLSIFASASVLADESTAHKDIPVNLNSIPFGITLSQSKLIYPLNSQGTTLTVNNPQEYPVLVKSSVINEDRITEAPFSVIPPLFRLDAKQKNTLKIVRTDGVSSLNNESLYWLCVKGIPPSDDDLWTGAGKQVLPQKNINLNLLVSMDNCIKLLTRPKGLNSSPADVGGKLTWQLKDNSLIVTNPTPFYMSLSSVTFNGKPMRFDYISPGSSQKTALPGKKSSTDVVGKVSWHVLDDFGGESQMWTEKVH